MIEQCYVLPGNPTGVFVPNEGFAIHCLSPEEAKRVCRFVNRLQDAERENNVLRKKLADGSDPCVYCGLPANKIEYCERGFPGCARMDDKNG